MKHLLFSTALIIVMTVLVLISAIANPSAQGGATTLVMGSTFLILLIIGSIITHPSCNKTPLRFWITLTTSTFVGLLLVVLISYDVFLSEVFIESISGRPTQLGAFFIITFALFFILNHEKIKHALALGIALTYSLALAVSVEYIQYFIQHTPFNPYDVIFRFIGAFSFYLLAHLIYLISGIYARFKKK